MDDVPGDGKRPREGGSVAREVETGTTQPEARDCRGHWDREEAVPKGRVACWPLALGRLGSRAESPYTSAAVRHQERGPASPTPSPTWNAFPVPGRTCCPSALPRGLPPLLPAPWRWGARPPWAHCFPQRLAGPFPPPYAPGGRACAMPVHGLCVSVTGPRAPRTPTATSRRTRPQSPGDRHHRNPGRRGDCPRLSLCNHESLSSLWSSGDRHLEGRGPHSVQDGPPCSGPCGNLSSARVCTHAPV